VHKRNIKELGKVIKPLHKHIKTTTTNTDYPFAK